MTDTLPTSTSFEPAGSDPAWSCSGSTCLLTISDLAAGKSRAFALVVRVDATLPAGLYELVNAAVVAPDRGEDRKGAPP